MEMTKEIALKAIAVIATGGLLFSGYLSYQELFAGAGSCPAAAAAGISSILGIPVCVYGFLMYLLVLAISLAGLSSKK